VAEGVERAPATASSGEAGGDGDGDGERGTGDGDAVGDGTATVGDEGTDATLGVPSAVECLGDGWTASARRSAPATTAAGRRYAGRKKRPRAGFGWRVPGGRLRVSTGVTVWPEARGRDPEIPDLGGGVPATNQPTESYRGGCRLRDDIDEPTDREREVQ
jgi:hypothetical protein